MSEEKSLHPERLLKQSSRIESSETAEGTDKKPLGAHDAVYALLRTAELAASLRRGRNKSAKKKLYRPGRIRLKVDEDVPERPPKAEKYSENKTHLRLSEDSRHPSLHTSINSKTNSHLLSKATGNRLRFDRPKRGGVQDSGSRTADRALQYRSQQQRFSRLRFSQGSKPKWRDFTANAPENISAQPVPESAKRQLRFVRPSRIFDGDSSEHWGGILTQGERQKRLYFSPQSVRAQSGMAPKAIQLSDSRLVAEPTKRRLRFEKLAPSPISDSSGTPQSAVPLNQRHQQRLRFSPQSGRVRQSTTSDMPLSAMRRPRVEPEKRRLRFEQPSRNLTGASKQPHLGISGQQSARINLHQPYKRLRFSESNRLWQPGTADSAGSFHLRSHSVPGPGRVHQEPHALQQSGQTGLIPVAGPPEAGLHTTAMKQQTYGSDFHYYASYTVWEERKTQRFLDNGEGRKSRLKFEDDRKLLGSGAYNKPLNDDKDKFSTDKNIRKEGFFASALRHETDRMLDEIARSTEDPAVEGANAERKVASAGGRYGLKYGKKWRGNHDQRVAQREVTRANKQYIRDAKEQIYQQQYGRPSRSSRWRQTMQGYGKQARKFTERKLGAKATAEIEKIIAIIAKKGAAVIRVVAAYVGAPLLGIILAFILLFLLAMLFVGGVQNSAVTVLTAYTAEDTEIEAASSYYSRLEAELDKEIKNVSIDWKWQHIDAFHYDLDDIGHDPFKLMAYLSVKYPGFTFDQVKTEMDYIFDHCYTLTYDEWSETRGDPPDTYTYYHLDVTLRAKPMEPLLLQELAKDAENDLVSWYDVLMETKGAHQGYANPFDINWSDKVSSLYGYRVDPIGGRELQQHRGLDISMPTGTPIKAGLTGTVRYVGYDAVMGNYIIIDTDEGDKTMKYGHCDEVQVSVGDQIAAGETVVGTVGNTGQSTGPHLHVEILENGEYLNPIYSLNYKAS